MPACVARIGAVTLALRSGGNHAKGASARGDDPRGAGRWSHAGIGAEIGRHAAHRLARCDPGRRSLRQRASFGAGPRPSGLGHAGGSRSGDVPDRAPARHVLEMGRSHDARIHPAPACDVPERRSLHRRRCGLHDRHHHRPGFEGLGAEQLRLDRRGDEDRHLPCRDPAQARLPRRPPVPCHGGADLSESLSREGGRGRICGEADRRRAVRDHPCRRRERDRSPALRGLLSGQPEGRAEDRQHRHQGSAGRNHHNHAADRWAGRLDLAIFARPVQRSPAAPGPHRDARRDHADRLHRHGRRRPQRQERSVHEPQGAPGAGVRRRSCRHRREISCRGTRA